MATGTHAMYAVTVLDNPSDRKKKILKKKENKITNLKLIKKTFLSCAMTTTLTTFAVTRIRTWVVAATTRRTNHYTITAITAETLSKCQFKSLFMYVLDQMIRNCPRMIC